MKTNDLTRQGKVRDKVAEKLKSKSKSGKSMAERQTYQDTNLNLNWQSEGAAYIQISGGRICSQDN